MTATLDPRRVAFVGGDDDFAAVTKLLDGEPRRLPAGARAPLRAGAAAVTIVGDPAAARAAALRRRLTRTPWVALLDDPGDGVWAADAQARIVAGPVATASGRVVSLEEPDRARRVLEDIALADGARRGGPLAIAGDVWTFFDDRATRFSIRMMQVTGRSPVPVHPRHLLDEAADRWYLRFVRPAGRLLDVGCANGAHTLAAAAVAAEVIGVDMDATALEHARERARREGIASARFEPVDLAHDDALTTLGAGSFDTILLLDVLEHVVDRVDLLARLRRLLAEDGQLVIAVPHGDTPYRRTLRRIGAFAYMDPDHKVEYTDASLLEEVRGAGLAVVASERGGFDSAVKGLSNLVAVVSLRAYGAMGVRRRRLAAAKPQRATALRLVVRAA